MFDYLPDPSCCSDPDYLCANCALLALNARSEQDMPDWYDDVYEEDDDTLGSPVLTFDDEDDENGPAFDRGPLAGIGRPARGSGGVAANNGLVANGFGGPDCLIEPIIDFRADAAAHMQHAKRCACHTANQRQMQHEQSPHPTLLIPPTIVW